ncbi:hypothetical protein SAY86_001975 [Trapa natans]|uniref:NAC domain-containing protein n=1 Tax=Trapa natans TaxID=22666 RepID=A0AAN7LR80_TRANT|nr:hypothetical protein SAY86_001975 [Trapa natans]
MEKLNFVKNGVLRLPPGFRFHPTDEELVVQYLKRKVNACPLPASIIPEVDVCKSDPWDLPGDMDQERYFFSTREAKYPNGNRSNRATGSGYWKATGIDRQIVVPRGGGIPGQTQLVGMKKTLVFYRGKPPHGAKTDWIMHEYRLASSDLDLSRVSGLNEQLNQFLKKNWLSNEIVTQKYPTFSYAQSQENWVLCRIFLKKRASKNDEDSSCKVNCRNEVVASRVVRKITNLRPVFYDFMGGNCNLKAADLNLGPDSPHSAGSSSVTELSSRECNDDHDDGSSCNSFPYFRSSKP